MQRHLAIALAVITAVIGWTARDLQDKPSAQEDWSFHSMAELSKQRAAKKTSYLPFVSRDTLSCGVYALPKGGTDGQSPHALDEVYYVTKGKASFSVGTSDATKTGEAKETRKVETGSVLFVKRGAEHRFHDITEDLEVLVFFSKAKVLKK